MENLSSFTPTDSFGDCDGLVDLSAYCMFLGYARSGHSLVGALLDAHPHVIIADQLDALEKIQAGVGKEHLFYLLLQNSRSRVEEGRARGGHSYRIPGQWQGSFTTLKVIGDKKGQRATLRLRQDPELLKKLGEVLGLPIKIFHVIRNPYDNIATKYLKRSRHGVVDFRALIEEHFLLCETVKEIKGKIKKHIILDVYHEALIENPAKWIRILCDFLGIDCPDNYLSSCSDVIFSSPNKSRHDVVWSQEEIELVRAKICSFDFLSHYSFEL